MANSLEIQIADAVVSAINAATWTEVFRAERIYGDIDTPLEELDRLRVDVLMPEAWDAHELDDQSNDSCIAVFEIAIRKNFGMAMQNQVDGGGLRDELDRLYTLAVDMARVFMTDAFDSLTAHCIDTQLLQAYDREMLATMGQFTAVIQLTFDVRRAL